MCLAVLAITAGSAEALDNDFYAPSSKLAEGQWVKIAVQESGIYQITTDDISNWGLGSDLSQIHIFGYGGAPLSEVMQSDNYFDDLPQVPVVRSGDRILFYAQGPTTWKRQNNLIPYVKVQHPYANTGYYLVTNSARYDDIDITLADNSPTGPIKSTYIERLYHEQNIINPGHTGRNYLGENFVNNYTQTFQFDLNGLVDSSMVSVYPVFAAKTTDANGSLTYWYNGTQLEQTNADIIRVCNNLNFEHYRLAESVKQFTLDGTDQLWFRINFYCPGTVYEARLDFITVNYERHLAMRNGCLAFGLDNASNDNTYQLTGCAGPTRVWDVTVPSATVQQNITTTDGIAAFSPSTSGRREFIAFDESATAYSHPELVGKVSNQDIHAQATPDMIILAPAAYLEQAQRVAALHERYDHFSVLVLDHEQVFNEFSSGTPDAMAYRRLCKMFYDRGESQDGHRLQYLLLFGGGNYDNRLIDTEASSLDYPKLITWQSKISFSEEESFTTDDYFAVLDDGSGINDNEKMNIAVGRMIFRSEDEARTVVDKLENYITKPDYGSWKNRIMFVADDEDNAMHMQQSNRMVNTIRGNGGENLVYDYVYIDAFDAVSEGGRRTYPDARAKMFNSLSEGSLWWNYIGRSNTQQWTNEGLLTPSDVESQLNYSHLPVLYAATADFFRFDNDSLSSGEHMFINPNGGVIAAICPARLTYLSPNGQMDRAVGGYIFAGDESGRPTRIGDIIKMAKNDVPAMSNNHRRFFVFGDPAMRLAYAPLTARIETINGR
ncbi:MAG: type IX secretion system sortase PorU, partial [Muribaculaceae bacterium]|nr:type IX secretion system sortase PorU [Muribaculaceae bacterium]